MRYLQRDLDIKYFFSKSFSDISNQNILQGGPNHSNYKNILLTIVESHKNLVKQLRGK